MFNNKLPAYKFKIYKVLFDPITSNVEVDCFSSGELK